MPASFLLLQVRDFNDPIRIHEADCFQRVLGLAKSQLETFNLLSGLLPPAVIEAADMIMVGGSGKYSAVGEHHWLDVALESLRLVCASGKPTFASCWGFQAMARAMGGAVEHRPHDAEVGSFPIEVTADGYSDALFQHCDGQFFGQLGHEDFVTRLPAGTTLLAKSQKALQAFRFDDQPIYCTQFHPEINKADLITRLEAYPEYVELATGLKLEELIDTLQETPIAEKLLMDFRDQFVGAHGRI